MTSLRSTSTRWRAWPSSSTEWDSCPISSLRSSPGTAVSSPAASRSTVLLMNRMGWVKRLARKAARTAAAAVRITLRITSYRRFMSSTL